MGERYRISFEVEVAPAGRPSYTVARAGRVAELTRDFMARLRHVEVIRAARLEPLDMPAIAAGLPTGLEDPDETPPEVQP